MSSLRLDLDGLDGVTSSATKQPAKDRIVPNSSEDLPAPSLHTFTKEVTNRAETDVGSEATLIFEHKPQEAPIPSPYIMEEEEEEEEPIVIPPNPTSTQGNKGLWIAALLGLGLGLIGLGYFVLGGNSETAQTASTQAADTQTANTQTAVWTARFTLGSTHIDLEQVGQENKAALRGLRACKGTVVVEAYVCALGTHKRNIKVLRQRGQSAAAYLRSHGVRSGRIHINNKTDGHLGLVPLADNRRAEAYCRD